MNNEFDNINIYNDSSIIINEKTPKSIISWITILIILSLIMIIIFSIPFNIYLTLNGYVTIEDNETYLNLLLENSDFPINKKNELYIKNVKYDYSIVNIDRENMILKVDLKDEIKLENNIVIVNLVKDRTTVFKLIKNKIKKGFGL